MKKVLIITFYFPPAATAAIHRILGFSKYLPDFGWEPIILTVKKKYYDEKILTYDTTDEVSDNLLIYKTGMIGWVRDLLKIIRYLLKTKGFTKEKQNINIIKDNSKLIKNNKLKALLKLLKQLIMLPDDKIWWAPMAILKALSINSRHRFDVIFTTGGPFSTHLIGLYVSRLLNKPWIADFQDPWVSNPIMNWDFAIVKNLVMKMEKKVLTNADLIITNTKAVKEDFEKNYPYLSPDKFYTITNGYNAENFKNVEKIDLDKFTITYTGSLYVFHSLTPFLKGIKNLLERKKDLYEKIQVLIFGSFSPVHEKEIEDIGLKKIVHLKGPKSHEEVIKYIISSHVLLVTLTTKEKRSLFIPCKIFDYLASGRQILSISPEGELAEIIRNNAAGRVVYPDDIDGISKAIELFYEEFMSEALHQEKKKKIEKYDAKNLTFELSKLLNTFLRKEKVLM